MSGPKKLLKEKFQRRAKKQDFGEEAEGFTFSAVSKESEDDATMVVLCLHGSRSKLSIFLRNEDEAREVLSAFRQLVQEVWDEPGIH